ncbi:MAG: formylglycine-generating enzyme family protein, partial [Chloroflexi bacterium]|nr:formylglycine-generating enzyme family protein [Chloroflexota bacterium]
MADNKIPLFKSGKDGRPMVKVPAGKFFYGEDDEEIELKEFFIDLYPVTNKEFKVFVDATAHPDPAHWRNRTWPDGKENHPVVEVNWKSAAAYAEWAGKRLPTNEEWEKAARGTDGRLWPWGNKWDINNANAFSGDTTPVGQYSPRGDSPFGAADMAGNVWEWIGGISEHALRAPLRGGDWLDGPDEAMTFHIRM